MRSLFVFLLLMLASAATAHGQTLATTDFAEAQSAGKCIVFAHAGPGQVHLVNSCAECRTAVMSWCDGSIRKVQVPAHDTRTIATCIGTITLATDIPCSASISSADVLKQLPAGSSCSAKNDLGDTCSISCPEGEAAHCTNGTGSASPTCECR